MVVSSLHQQKCVSVHLTYEFIILHYFHVQLGLLIAASSFLWEHSFLDPGFIFLPIGIENYMELRSLDPYSYHWYTRAFEAGRTVSGSLPHFLPSGAHNQFVLCYHILLHAKFLHTLRSGLCPMLQKSCAVPGHQLSGRTTGMPCHIQKHVFTFRNIAAIWQTTWKARNFSFYPHMLSRVIRDVLPKAIVASAACFQAQFEF